MDIAYNNTCLTYNKIYIAYSNTCMKYNSTRITYSNIHNIDLDSDNILSQTRKGFSITLLCFFNTYDTLYNHFCISFFSTFSAQSSIRDCRWTGFYNHLSLLRYLHSRCKYGISYFVIWFNFGKLI